MPSARVIPFPQTHDNKNASAKPRLSAFDLMRLQRALLEEQNYTARDIEQEYERLCAKPPIERKRPASSR